MSTPPEFPPLPEPVAHLHSNGDFCQDKAVPTPSTRSWPAYLFTADQMHAYLLADRNARAAAGAPSVEPTYSWLIERIDQQWASWFNGQVSGGDSREAMFTLSADAAVRYPTERAAHTALSWLARAGYIDYSGDRYIVTEHIWEAAQSVAPQEAPAPVATWLRRPGSRSTAAQAGVEPKKLTTKRLTEALVESGLIYMSGTTPEPGLIEGTDLTPYIKRLRAALTQSPSGEAAKGGER